jgi:hypothetical protein
MRHLNQAPDLVMPEGFPLWGRLADRPSQGLPALGLPIIDLAPPAGLLLWQFLTLLWVAFCVYR